MREMVETICPPCFGYGRCPTGEVDWYDGTDRGTHCDHCDGRGVVQVEVEPAEVEADVLSVCQGLPVIHERPLGGEAPAAAVARAA